MSMLFVRIALTLLLCSSIAGDTRSSKIVLFCGRSGRYPPPYLSVHADDVLLNVISNVRFCLRTHSRFPIWRTTATVRCRCHPRPDFRVTGLLLFARSMRNYLCFHAESRNYVADTGHNCLHVYLKASNVLATLLFFQCVALSACRWQAPEGSMATMLHGMPPAARQRFPHRLWLADLYSSSFYRSESEKQTIPCMALAGRTPLGVLTLCFFCGNVVVPAGDLPFPFFMKGNIMSNKAYRGNTQQSDRNEQASVRETWQLPYDEQAKNVPRPAATYPHRPAKRKITALEECEQRAWVSFYRNIGDPIVAIEVLRLLDTNSEIRSDHLGLYLHAKRSIRMHKQRQLRALQLAGGLRFCGRILFIAPIMVTYGLTRRFVGLIGSVLAACARERITEPAAARLRDVAGRGKTAKPAGTDGAT